MRKLLCVFAALLGAACVAGAVVAVDGRVKAGAITVRPVAATATAAPAAAGTGGGPCFQGHPVPNPCASPDPQVSLRIYTSSGDTTGCSFTATVAWGDRTRTVQSFHGGALNATVALLRHLYRKPGTYAIKGSVASGSGSGFGFGCNGFGFSLRFVLQHLHAPTTLAALGDSFSSGEGTRDYDPMSRKCHRSPTWAWAELLRHDNPAITKVDLLACSGARSESLDKNAGPERAQLVTLKNLTPRPDLVTITMGGNDVGFADVLRDCFLHDCLHDGVTKEAERKIAAERGKLITDYQRIRWAVPNATVLAVGYPEIFNDHRSCERYDWAKLAEMNRLGALLDDQVRASAEHVGIGYVDVSGVFRGHEECAKDSWLYPITLRTGAFQQEPGHPTKPGQQAVAAAVSKYLSEHL